MAGNLEINILFQGKTAKIGEKVSDCQDDFMTDENLFAIADGASQSFYPRIWSKLLVNHYCADPNITEDNWKQWLVPIQEKWILEVKNKIDNFKKNNSPVWLTNSNRLNNHTPAVSTFIGLNIKNTEKNIIEFEQIIVGDSCLFILVDNIIKSYPFDNPNEFSDRPEYFASYPSHNNYNPTIIKQTQEVNVPMFFILSTDALSEWILKNTDSITRILSIKNDSEFNSFISEIRNSDNCKLKDDDVTLLIIQVQKKGKPGGTKLTNDKKVSDNNYGRQNVKFIQKSDSIEEIQNTSISDQNLQKTGKIKNTPPEPLVKKIINNIKFIQGLSFFLFASCIMFLFFGLHERRLKKNVNRSNAILVKKNDSLKNLINIREVRPFSMSSIDTNSQSKPGIIKTNSKQESINIKNAFIESHKIYYKIKEKETLEQIANKFGVTIESLKINNPTDTKSENLNGDSTIKIGLRLYIKKL